MPSSAPPTGNRDMSMDNGGAALAAGRLASAAAARGRGLGASAASGRRRLRAGAAGSGGGLGGRAAGGGVALASPRCPDRCDSKDAEVSRDVFGICGAIRRTGVTGAVMSSTLTSPTLTTPVHTDAMPSTRISFPSSKGWNLEELWSLAWTATGATSDGTRMEALTSTEPSERARSTCSGKMPGPASVAMACFVAAWNDARSTGLPISRA